MSRRQSIGSLAISGSHLALYGHLPSHNVQHELQMAAEERGEHF
ncbi:hypothetical protein ACFLRX_05910 [Acidobacteriota bacterium]